MAATREPPQASGMRFIHPWEVVFYILNGSDGISFVRHCRRVTMGEGKWASYLLHMYKHTVLALQRASEQAREGGWMDGGEVNIQGTCGTADGV